jgi:aminoglycoside phosphotransferase (APT) family kinase protein
MAGAQSHEAIGNRENRHNQEVMMSREFESIMRIMRDSLAGISPADVQSSEVQSIVAISADLLSLLLDANLDGTLVPRDPWAPVNGEEAPPSDTPASYTEAEALSATLATLMRNGEDPIHAESRAGQLGRSLVARHQWIEDRLKAGRANRSSEDIRPPRLTVDGVNDYLRLKGVDAIVTEVSYIPGGYSRETILLSLAPGSRYGDALVLRKVVDGHDPSHLLREWSVLVHVADLDLPSPTPFWIEEDPSHLGNAFFTVNRMPGRNHGDVFGGASVSPDLMKQLARYLARLHSADARSLQTLPRKPLCSKDTVTEAIQEMAQVIPRLSDFDRPLYKFAVAWMLANIPEDVERPSLLHGDVGLHNMLIDNGRLSAMLDWERSHLGSPAEEFAYIYDMVVSIMPWDEFLDEYTAEAGERPSEEALRFYSVWSDIWRCSGGLDKRWLFVHGPSPRISAAAAGFLVSPRFLLSAVNRVVGIKRTI